MLPGVTELDTMVRSVIDQLRELSANEPALAEPLASIIESAVHLHGELAQAITSGSEEDQRTAACKLSGMRKGILELSLLDHRRDAAIIAAIDGASDQALEICLA